MHSSQENFQHKILSGVYHNCPVNISTLSQRYCYVNMSRDVIKHQNNAGTTLNFATLNNVKSTLSISTLTLETLEKVETALLFSASSFTTLVNVETTL